ncbi:Spindle assembly checkpoint component mad1 [Sphaceloma murrayae]|uniref:Spindle assembly checkpoint component mad1 n=1 Tax=Sphaceloma murrayae TaxID=2082308 RepID=A0A2K1R1I7_9PEZI|nr:Spindle assembly checkpoint component mad1 [Sphaceloma murrayae]
MDRSLTLINAQIQFLDTRLALLHIPLHLYPHFIQPILQLLALVGIDEPDEDGIPRRPWAFYYPFANISVTTIECSIVCPRHLVTELFSPILCSLSPTAQSQVSISRDDFVVIAVGGEGTEAGQRVLDLTAPLALAGISIFFITSYYSDFVLVPLKARTTVITALESQGFAFSPQPNGHSQMTNISSPLHGHHHKKTSSSSTPSSNSGPNPFFQKSSPTTPPASTIEEWQSRTFALLRRTAIHPVLDTTLRLASAAAHRADHATQARLMHHITSCLITSPPPRFLSLTFSDTDSLSLTLDRDLLRRFPGSYEMGFKGSGDGYANGGGIGGSGAEVLLLSDEVTVPISLDLRDLPEESTGIVCGVAGRLLERMGGGGRRGVNISYLSTVRAGNVLVGEEEVEEALEALREIEGGAC